MTPAGRVEIQGLSELRRVVRKLDRESGQKAGLPAFREHLKAAAGVVADEAKRRAPVRTGRLQKWIRPSVRGTSAYVRAMAKSKPSRRYPKGYRYSGRVHFDTTRKHTEFLYPVLEEKREEVMRMMEGVLDAIENAWREGGDQR